MKEKVTRVFQMSFDIATADIANSQDQQDLFNEINHLIDNYMSIKQEPLHFTSVGCYNAEDMSDTYGEAEIKELNRVEPNNNFQALYNPYTRRLAVWYGEGVTTHSFECEEAWTKASFNCNDDHPNYLHIQLDYDETCQLIFYSRVDGSDRLNEHLTEAWHSGNSGNSFNSSCIKIAQDDKEWNRLYKLLNN